MRDLNEISSPVRPSFKIADNVSEVPMGPI
jgi:hypothetical protein